MTIASVSVDGPVTASMTNQLIANVNSSPGVAIFTANGTWAVPSGVHKFRVTLCGGGGPAGEVGIIGGGEDVSTSPGGPGGDSLARRVWVSGVDIGSSYSITIGAGGASGGTGGTTSFGALLTLTGGGVGASNGTGPTIPGSKGSLGNTVGGTLAGSAVAIGTKVLPVYDAPDNIPRNYGEGGTVTQYSSQLPGAPGIVVIEW